MNVIPWWNFISAQNISQCLVEFFFIFEKKGQPDQSLLRRLEQAKKDMTVLIKDQVLDHW